jgi:cytochrome c oxidase subunit II
MTHRSPRRKAALALTGVAVLAVVLAGCGAAGPNNKQNSFRPKGPEAQKIFNLFTPIAFVATVVGILVVGATIFVAIRFRARPGRDDRPKQIHGSTPLEIGWTLIPAVILAVIAVPTVSTIFDLHSEPGPGALHVVAIGKQWWWQFEYPKDSGGKQVVVADELHIPTGRQIRVDLRACDPSLGTGASACNVIHSFWVPELAGKTDVVPGHNNWMKMEADHPGTYLGQCAEYCGLSHANMRFRVIAQTPSDFDEWLAGQRDGPAVPLDQAGEAGDLFTKTFQCTNCHTTSDSSLSTYGPNLTHFASRTTFASGYYPLTRQNLINWILNAPSMIPMQSKDCRLPPPATCVGMPSFTENTPPGQPTMTHQQAETLADYLLQLK